MAKTARGKGKRKNAEAPSRAVRNLVALILLVAITAALVVELNARRGHSSASDAVDRLMAKHHDEPLTRSKVEAVVNRKPDGPAVRQGMEQVVTYTWRGLKPHVLKLYYVVTEDGTVDLVRMEAP